MDLDKHSLMEYLANPYECNIYRDLEAFPNRAVVIHDGGHLVLSVAAANFTDKQIENILHCVNTGFSTGYNLGRTVKVDEIKRALEIS